MGYARRGAADHGKNRQAAVSALTDVIRFPDKVLPGRIGLPPGHRKPSLSLKQTTGPGFRYFGHCAKARAKVQISSFKLV